MYALERVAVRVKNADRPGEDLSEIRRAAGDVSADEIRVAPLEVRGEERVARDDAVAKARRVPLDLRLDALAHVYRRAVGHMAVRPERMLSRGRTRRIEHRRLHGKNVRTLVHPAVPGFLFAGRDLPDRAAKVQRACVGAAF